jgi:hypothetical protein
MPTCLAGGGTQRPRGFFWRSCTATRTMPSVTRSFRALRVRVQRLFPQQVAATAVALAQLHALTEQLDHAMGHAWIGTGCDGHRCRPWRYVAAWRGRGAPAGAKSSCTWCWASARNDQAHAHAGSAPDAQDDAWARCGRARPLCKAFWRPALIPSAPWRGKKQAMLKLSWTRAQREAALITMLFDARVVACETELQRTLGLAR